MQRNQVRRLPVRAHYNEQTIHAVLDAGCLCHVAFAVDGQPFVIPTLYGREGSRIFLHGSAASRMLRQLATGIPASISVAHLDGLVLAKSAFHHSVNYRSAVLFGTAKQIEDQERKPHALEVISESVIRGRWREARLPTDHELKATSVVEFEIEEASAKIRTGGPIDDEEDLALPIWAGVVPIAMTFGAPVSEGPEPIADSVRALLSTGGA